MTRPNPDPNPPTPDATVALPASPSRATGTEPDTLGGAGPAPELPAAVGPYPVREELGRGGMGVVYRAEDPALRREVALKVMLPQLAVNPQARARFVREARAQARVEHDHVAVIHHVGEVDGVPFLVMPLLKGMTLSAALKVQPRPPLPEVIRIGREIADGLAAAHEQGLVHRDVKPGNIWLEGKKLRVKVLDFGLARGVGSEEAPGAGSGTDPVTREGAVVGTPSYMSPEQGAGLAVDGRTDLWGLGVVLYQMTTGELPFRGVTAVATLIAASTEDPPAPHEANPAVPPALSDLVMRLLAKKPSGRPPTAEVVADELRRIEAELAGAVRVIPLDAPPPIVLGDGGPDPFADLDATELNTSLARAADQPAAVRAKPKGGFPVWAAAAGMLLAAGGVVWVVAQQLGKKPAGVTKEEPPRKDTKPNPQPGPKPKPVIDPHRRLAEWAIDSAPGQVSLGLRNHPEVKSPADLPKEPFEVAHVNMPLVDALVRGPDPFADVTPLPGLNLRGDWSGEQVERLAARLAGRPFPTLGVRLHVAPQTGRTLAAFARVEAVQSLDLFNFTALTAADVAGLKALPHLQALNLSGPAVTDEVLAPLAEFPALRHAIFGEPTKLTAAGVAKLAAAAPWLKITSDHGSFEPKLPPPLTAAEAKQLQAAEAERLGLPVEAENDIGMRLVLVPPGRFLMGSPADERDRRENEGPRHEAAIARAFYAGAHEVTQEQYKTVTGADPSVTKGPRRPVESVSWADAVGFCRQLSGRPAELKAGRVYRLPTEAEWEYACRAGAQTAFHFGDDPADLHKYVWCEPFAKNLTHPVGSLLPNAWGLYDTHGNVWELCSDFYRADYYHTAPRLDPRGPATGTTYGLRGGYRANPASEARAANRWPDWAGEPFANVGFRVACDVRTPDEAVARYFLQRAPFVPGTGGFTLTLRLPDNTEVVVGTAAELPAGPFTLVSLTRNGPQPPPFTDADFARLEATPALTGFAAPGLEVTTAGLRSLLVSKKSLRNLYLAGAPLTDDHLEVIAGFAELDGLHVGAVGSKVTDAGIAHLAGLTKLRMLTLHDTSLTDAGLKPLAALPLAWLELANTAVSDAGVETLATMTGLTGLGLRGTRVTADGVKKLQAALPKCRIDWAPADPAKKP